MLKPLRIFDGPFGRVVLGDALAPSPGQAHAEHLILVQREGPALAFEIDDERAAITREAILFVNAGERVRCLPEPGAAPTRLLAVHLAPPWLAERFPALPDDAGRAFPRAPGEITARIRRLADTLAVEILNDQFLAADRIEFMLQELMLSILETYLTGRRAASPLWRGSRFADHRIRRAIQLLRANPNKDVNIDELASQVGLSRSRFYDLFQVCTGHSPREYLDKLCVEAAIGRLAAGGTKISELSAELGFSAQSNFTRFFLNQVGIPPSAYRRASARRGEDERGA